MPSYLSLWGFVAVISKPLPGMMKYESDEEDEEEQQKRTQYRHVLISFSFISLNGGGND